MNFRRAILTVSLLAAGGAPLTSLARQRVPSGVPKEVIEQFFKDLCPKGCSDEEVALWKSNLKHESHDLNRDGVPEFFLYVVHSDWCGAGGNCSYSVYRKRNKRYELLLDDKVLRVLDSSTRGYRDLASEFPMGACDGGRRSLRVTLYKYDGNTYRARGTKDECREPKH